MKKDKKEEQKACLQLRKLSHMQRKVEKFKPF